MGAANISLESKATKGTAILLKYFAVMHKYFYTTAKHIKDQSSTTESSHPLTR
jgi:hypothetical protein